MLDKNLCYKDFCQKYPLLLHHLEAVLQHNQHVNLTSITSQEAGKVLHIEDSLAVLPELLSAPQGVVADLGSGAGYPGIPLALVSGRTVVLIESNKKKARFLHCFLSEHGLLEHIRVEACRSEELAQAQRAVFAVVTARAVAELPALVELAAPLLMREGHFIALKGTPDEAEITRAVAAAGLVGMEQIVSRSYVLSDRESKRSIFVYRKCADTPPMYPRRPGMATKRPLF